MENQHPVGIEDQSLSILVKALKKLGEGFEGLDVFDAGLPDRDRMEAVLLETAARLQENYPFFHPLYAGQMLKPPHPVARLAYMLSLYINPNNHALDGGRASSAMEKEAVAKIAAMFGWDTHLGHLASGGTLANLEALFVAGRLHPGKMIVASSQAHYTHSRLTGVLGIPFRSIPVDRLGRMDPVALEEVLKKEAVGTVVATIGTTATGAIDPLPGLLELQKKYGFRIHADTAYGGYFTLTDHLSAETRRAFDRLEAVDSIVVDPHKHGLQPYGCGCILFRDPAVGRFYKHDSPYTYFSSDDLHLGEISLECSRPGAAAVALWATQQLLPMERNGELARMLDKGRQAALSLYAWLSADRRFITAFEPELDIVIWIPRGGTVSEISGRSRRIFDEAARQNLHLALAELPCSFFPLEREGITADRETVTALRSVLMKPEHEEWLDRIREILGRSAGS